MANPRQPTRVAVEPTSPIDALVVDFDGTLVPFAGPDDPAWQATADFAHRWQQLPAAARPAFVVNSGRMVDDLAAAVSRTPLPRPDFLIGGVGTQVCDGEGEPLPGYHESLGACFELQVVECIVGGLPGITRQPDAYQSRFKSSWFWEDVSAGQIDQLQTDLASAGVEATVIYSSRRDLDVIPARADKGRALCWLSWFAGWSPCAVVVGGDSGNDARMFAVPGVRGIIVGNGHDDLRGAAGASGNTIHEARAEAAGGLLEGLQAFGLLSGD